mmetsp:Transcript_34142/g.37736  ORF Transcript_34142/g.37736 Transcript_34142/m.37736 type:complete len:289 (+) Transcript_34142:242-1108(+)
MNCSCLFSAFCFIVSNALGIAVIVEDKLRPSYSEIALRSLDPEYIQLSWNHRRNIAPLVQCSHVFNCLAWLFLLPPVLQLAWSLSRGGKRKVGIHTAIGGFAIAGCTTEILSRLLLLGGWGAAQWISTDFNLNYWIDSGDSLGWKTLEVVYIVMEGLLNWVDAFEWICLFVIMSLLYYSIGTQLSERRALSLGWGRLGLVIAFLCVLDFAADLLKVTVEWRTFQNMAIISTIINTCVLLPLWLLWLSCTIHKVMPSTNDEDDYATDPIWNRGIPLSEQQQQRQTTSAE